jgi:hypothetical protein
MEEVAQWGASYFVLLPKYYWADQIKENEVGGTCGTHGRGMCTRFWWEGQKERDHLEGQGVDRMGSEWILRKLAGGVWIGFSWLRIGTCVRLLWIRWWTFGFWRYGVSYLVLIPDLTGAIWTIQCLSVMLVCTLHYINVFLFVNKSFSAYYNFLYHYKLLGGKMTVPRSCGCS